MLFLTDVDHVSFEKANETRQNNLQHGGDQSDGLLGGHAGSPGRRCPDA